MRLVRRIRDMKLSGKMILFFAALVLCQFFVSLAILTTIISRTSLDSLRSRMTSTLQGVEGLLGETFRDLRVKGELIAGQKKTIEYTDFGLKTLLARELVVFRESLGIDSISVFTDPGYPFASTEKFAPTDRLSREELAQAFKGDSRLYVSKTGSDTQLFVLSPVRRANAIIGVLSLSLRVDADFVSRIEKTSGASIVFQFQDSFLHGDSLTDKRVQQVLAAYRHRPGVEGEVMMAGGAIVGTVELEKLGLPGGRIFCLLDTSESARLIGRYNFISLASTVLILSLALLVGFRLFSTHVFPQVPAHSPRHHENLGGGLQSPVPAGMAGRAGTACLHVRRDVPQAARAGNGALPVAGEACPVLEARSARGNGRGRRSPDPQSTGRDEGVCRDAA